MTDVLDGDSAPVPSTAEGVEEDTHDLWPARLGPLHERVRASPHYRWWALASVLFGLFAINVTFTVFAVALRRVAAEFHTTTNAITWVITGPLLAFGVLAPALGKAGDIWGHRRLYLIGVLGGIFCAVASAAAPTAGALIAARTLEGDCAFGIRARLRLDMPELLSSRRRKIAPFALSQEICATFQRHNLCRRF